MLKRKNLLDKNEKNTLQVDNLINWCHLQVKIYLTWLPTLIKPEQSTDVAKAIFYHMTYINYNYNYTYIKILNQRKSNLL